MSERIPIYDDDFGGIARFIGKVVDLTREVLKRRGGNEIDFMAMKNEELARRFTNGDRGALNELSVRAMTGNKRGTEYG